MGRTWTISDPKGFRETVQEVAPKLGEGYSEFIHNAVKERVKRLKGKDFEMAKKRVKLIEKKKQLSTIRERERTWLREKGHKKKNIERIKEDLNDAELEKEFLDLIKPRERLAEEVIELDKEVNPISEAPKKREISTEEIKRRIMREKARKRVRKIKKFCRRCVGNCLECMHYLQDVLDKPVGTGTNQFKEAGSDERRKRKR